MANPIADLWARMAARFSQLSTSDNKVYGIRNQQFYEIPSSGGGGGVTKANMEQLFSNGFNGSNAANTWYPEIGAFWNFNPIYEFSALATAETRSHLATRTIRFSTSNGALVTGSASFNATPIFTTGAAANGQLNLTTPQLGVMPLASISSISWLGEFVFSAASSAAQRYFFTAILGMGDGKDIHIRYIDNVNSNRVTISYYNAANVFTTVNTTFTPVAATNFVVTINATKTAGTWTLVISIDGTPVLTTTDTYLNAGVVNNTKVGQAVITLEKSVGTTPVTFKIESLYGSAI